MIKGMAKMEFGNGDIRLTGALHNNIGGLCCISVDPHKIGDKAQIGDKWNIDEAQVILTFTKVESIDVLIEELLDVKAMMQGTFEGSRKINNSLDIDFDTFIRNNSNINIDEISQYTKDRIKEMINNKYGRDVE